MAVVLAHLKMQAKPSLRALRNFKRQALHAVMLRLAHPITGEMMEWYTPLPDDFVELLHALKSGLPRTQRRIRLLR